MSTFVDVAKAEAYLHIQLTHPGSAGAPPPVGPFITISRQSGTGGSAIAQALMERITEPEAAPPWALYHGNLIEETLRSHHLPPQLARFLPEDRIHRLDGAVGELVGLHPDLWDLVDKTNEFIRHVAREGRVILLGRGANFATAGLPHGLHVRLVASESFRAACTARWLGVSPAAAHTHNSLRDAARRRYVRSTFGTDVDDPLAYDLVLNVESLPREAILRLILDAAAGRGTGQTPAHNKPGRRLAPAATRSTAESPRGAARPCYFPAPGVSGWLVCVGSGGVICTVPLNVEVEPAGVVVEPEMLLVTLEEPELCDVPEEPLPPELLLLPELLLPEPLPGLFAPPLPEPELFELVPPGLELPVPLVPPASVEVPPVVEPVVEPVVLPVVPPEPVPPEPVPLALPPVLAVEVNTACCVAIAISDATWVTAAATAGGRLLVPVTLTGVMAVIWPCAFTVTSIVRETS